MTLGLALRLLEDGPFEVMLVNPAHARNLPGAQDVSDATWLAQLGAHGLIRGSFVPPQPVRELRDLTRTRTAITRERTREWQHLEKLLAAPISPPTPPRSGVSQALVDMLQACTHDGRSHWTFTAGSWDDDGRDPAGDVILTGYVVQAGSRTGPPAAVQPSHSAPGTAPVDHDLGGVVTWVGGCQ